MEKFNFDFGQLKVYQLGFVFKNIEEQAKILQELYGLAPFVFFPIEKFPTNYKGNDSLLSGKLGFGQLGETQYELIEWKEGKSPYKDFLDQGREGFHHVGISMNDITPYVAEFKKRGIGILFSGDTGGVKFTYLDTEKTFGMILELIQQPQT
ncbi:hypothetical protein LCGC14_0553400 [marine sediment metagenome]|uniref:VOC domain-containing protein n=1 Tax=marine sediment metagenome TaxID=412755 RepID=A0A0F9RP77_9ZZZZ|nr:hypothetical protein [bacterium]